MWIVRLALDRPYTFVVLAILLLIFGPLAILTTSKDIFPNIGIPVVSTVWNFTGLPPDEMANRITGNFERAETTTVNDIEHIESLSLSSKLSSSRTSISTSPSARLPPSRRHSCAPCRKVRRRRWS